MVKISMYLKARKLFYCPVNTSETLLFGRHTCTKIPFSSYIYGIVKWKLDTNHLHSTDEIQPRIMP